MWYVGCRKLLRKEETRSLLWTYRKDRYRNVRKYRVGRGRETYAKHSNAMRVWIERNETFVAHLP